MTRRSPGEGSIYRRKDGRWVATGPGGKPTAYGRTKAAALGALERVRREHPEGRPRTAAMTLGDFLEQWLATWKARVRPTTHAQYDRALRRHARGLWAVPLRQITALRLDEQFSALLAAGTSPVAVRQYRTILGIALRQAVRWLIMPHNPIPDTTPPRAPRPHTGAWTLDEARTFLAAARGATPYWPAFALALGLGLRKSELAGLRLEDIDLLAGTLSIVQARVATRGGVFVSAPKSERGHRTLPLAGDVAAALGVWLDTRAAWERQAGELWQDSGLVFVREDGGALHPDRLRLAFRAAIAVSGVRPIRFHDQRHCSAIFALASGANLTSVSRRLGHYSPGFTLETYGDHQEGDDAGDPVRLLN